MLSVFVGNSPHELTWQRVEIIGDKDGLRELANFLLSLTDPANDDNDWPDVHYDMSGLLEGTLSETRPWTAGLRPAGSLDIRRAPPDWYTAAHSYRPTES